MPSALVHNTAGPAATLEQVYALDLAGVSEKLDVSEEEFLAGVARASTPRTLGQLLEPVAALASAESPEHRHIYRDACLLVPSASLTDRDDGLAVFEALVVELSRPGIMDHLVVCMPTEPRTATGAIARIIDRVYESLGIRVDSVAANDEITMLRGACQYLHRSPDAFRGSRSDGFLLVRSGRVFDASTLEMMMTAHNDCRDGDSDRLKMVTALVDLDVGGRPLQAPVNAGLYACSYASLGELEQLFTGENADWCHSIEDALAFGASSGALAVKSVVASDYCNWKTQPTMVTPSSASRPQRRRKSLGQSLHNGVGYSGFQIENVVNNDGEASSNNNSSRRRHYHDKEDATRLGSLANDALESTPSSSLLAKSKRDLELGSDADDSVESTLSAPDLEAVLGPHEQTFLLQTSTEEPQASGHAARSSRRSPRRREFILAVPDRKIPPNEPSGSTETSPFTLSRTSPRRRHFLTRLPTAVREIKVEASVNAPQSSPKSAIASSMAETASVSSLSASTSALPSAAATVKVFVKKQVPLVGYLILFTADIAVASQGAALNLLEHVPPLLKLFWRVSGAALAFLPLAVLSLRQHGLPPLSTRRKLEFVVCVVSHTWFNASFLLALSLTSIGHVYIFNNSHSLLIVVLKLMLRQPLSTQELMGAAIGFSGGAVTTLDHAKISPSESAAPSSVRGDLLAFAGAFGGVAYLLTAKRLRAAMDTPVFLCALMVCESLLLLAVLVTFRHELGVQLSPLSSRAGPIGWVWHHPFAEAYMVLVGSVVGTMGFIVAMKYFDPLVVSLGMLTEPVLATVIGVAVGVATVPGLPTFVGGAGVLFGCFLVIRASHRTESHVDVSDAVARVPGRRHSACLQRLPSASGGASFHTNYGSFP